MSCRGCLFVKVDVPSGGDVDDCFKDRLIGEFKEKHAESKKAMLYLNFETVRITDRRCARAVDDKSELCFEVQRSRAIEDYRVYLASTLCWVEQQPWSILRRKYAVKAVSAALRVHCCWKKCPDQACDLRRRGRHCPKQKQITGYFREVKAVPSSVPFGKCTCVMPEEGPSCKYQRRNPNDRSDMAVYCGLNPKDREG